MTKIKFGKVFAIHLGITLASGLIMLFFGELMFERHPPDGWSYVFLSVYDLIGFPVLDVTLVKMADGREIGDSLGAAGLLLIPINSMTAAGLILIGDHFRQRVLKKDKRTTVK